MGSLSKRDRRALLLLGAATVVFLLLQYGVLPRASGEAVSGAPPEVTEKRLLRLQQVARQRPRLAAEADAAARELKEVEKGLLRAATAAQASAEVLQTVKSLLGAQGVSLQSSEFQAIKPAGPDYAQVPLAATFTCGIDQWINFMTALRNAEQVLSTVDVRLSQNDAKSKTLLARVVVAGYIPASLAASAPKGGPGL